MTDETSRTCATCACSHTMKHPQLLNQEQMVCRRNGMMLANIQTMGPKGPTAQQGLMYALTTPEAVCFDGWRPIGILPGENWRNFKEYSNHFGVFARCQFGGNYGRCVLEAGHDGPHDVKK